MPKLLGRVLVPDAGSSALSLLLGADVILYRGAADVLATDDQFTVPDSQSIDQTKAMGLKVGRGGYAAWLQSTVNNAGDTWFGQNAYAIYSAVNLLDLRWNASHASFGSRGIAFSFSKGIQFFHDQVAATAGAAFTPTEIARFNTSGDLVLGTKKLGWSNTAGTGVIDANLYRAAAALLRTDGGLFVATLRHDTTPVANLGTAGFILSRGATDSVDRFIVRPGGIIEWGDGSNPIDVRLYRSAADELKTDDTFTCGGFKLPSGAGAGKVLTSDANGVGTWQAASSGSGSLITGSGAPAAGTGSDGAMYLDTATGRFYGPKAAGAWPGATHRLVPLTPTYAELTSG